MHISEPRVDPTLINHTNKVYKLRVMTIGTYRVVLAPSESNFKFDSIFHYR